MPGTFRNVKLYPRMIEIKPRAGDTPIKIFDTNGNVAESLANTGARTITATAAATVPLVLTGAASQTGHILDVKNSAGTITSYVDVYGRIWSQPTFTDATTGQSPSYKALYGNVTLNAGVTGGLQYFKAVQGWTNVGNGAVAPAEVWGTYGNVNTGATWSGSLLGAWPCVGELSLDGTGTFGANQANSFMSAGYFHSWVETTVTMAATAPIDAPLVGDIDMATGRRKADCAIAAVINGAINQSTAGAGAAFKVYDFTAGDPGFDYGLDLNYSSGSYENIFVKGDIRLKSANLIISGSETTRQGVETAFPTAPIGSVYLSSGTGGPAYIKLTDAGAATDWQRITTSAAD